eukprot:2708544-Prymnesium_polylepis.1
MSSAAAARVHRAVRHASAATAPATGAAEGRRQRKADACGSERQRVAAATVCVFEHRTACAPPPFLPSPISAKVAKMARSVDSSCRTASGTLGATSSLSSRESESETSVISFDWM